jgi:glycosyltransferase involved in cell wall biosynthesis
VVKVSSLRRGNKAFIDKHYDIAYEAYEAALIAMPELVGVINFNIELIRRRRGYASRIDRFETKAKAEKDQLPQALKKLPVTVLVITWDIGHNPVGRSYMIAEVVQRVARHSLLVGFQFPKYGNAIWEPVRNGQLPVITLPGVNLPEFYQSLNNIASRIRPDIVIACKPRLPSVALGMMIKEKWGCPLIVDVDDHELTFFKNQSELSLDELAALSAGALSKDTEPYAELWTRLTQSLCKSADEIIVSNSALQQEFGGTIIPHVRDENTFDPSQYNKNALRQHYGVPIDAKIVLFFGTPRVHKGVDALARAVSQTTDPNYRLLVVGAAPAPNVTAKLDQLAPGRVIYLPNQPFSAIPNILAMADLVCLPQDEGHAISKYQLPAKAIDAVAMGIPLLVSNTPPLLQLVNDHVAELVSTEGMPMAFERLAGNPEQVKRWRNQVRGKFIERYSYAAAAVQMHKLIQQCLIRQNLTTGSNIDRLLEVSQHVLGTPLVSTRKQREPGIDIVVFWKQNDTGLYGRRHDMVIKYLASRSDVRKVVVFDAPISEYDLIQRQQAGGINQHHWIYVGTYQKMLGTQDSKKTSYNVFVLPVGKYQRKVTDTLTDTHKPHLHEGYFPYVSDVLTREQVNARYSVFWIYPKNYSAPALVKHFQPAKVVVDVVDDHRAWPGISNAERDRLTQNYRDTLALADMAFANCQTVVESMREFFPGIRLVSNGCDVRPIRDGIISVSDKIRNSSEKRKTIVFVGNLEKKIDIPLLHKLARRFSDCDIILIGSTHANPEVLELNSHENIHFLGVIPYAEMDEWFTRADVGIIPHLNTDLTQSMNPLKLYIYLSWFVPVVSTEVQNIDTSSGFVQVARNHEEFLQLVAQTLEGEGRSMDRAAVQDYIEANSWRERFQSHIDELLQPPITLNNNI